MNTITVDKNGVIDQSEVRDAPMLREEIARLNSIIRGKTFDTEGCPQCAEKDAEIARLNAVIEAMAEEISTYPCEGRYWDGGECLGRKCAQCIIDHFTRQVQEGSDER